jgi:AraC-like DNA-binding protein
MRIIGRRGGADRHANHPRYRTLQRGGAGTRARGARSRGRGFPGERLALSHPEVLIALRRARELTDRDFAQPLTLDSMAQAAHLSKFHFARAFTKAYGETPRTYLTRRRIERAKDLLRAANLTITEICFLVGFESVGSFSSRFRDLVGMSPTEYRSASAGAPPIPGCFVLMWTRPGLARSQQSGRSTDDGRAVASGP